MLNFKLSFAYTTICCLLFYACTSTTQEDKIVYLKLNEQLEYSTNYIQESSEIYLQHLESNTHDPYIAERAKIWLLKANEIRKQTSNICKFLGNVKKLVASEDKSNRSKEIADSVTSFVSKISSLDSNMTAEFQFVIRSLPKLHDSTIIFSSNLSSEASVSLVSQLQNQITILESQLIVYCDNQLGSNNFAYKKAVPLINQNSNHLRNDEELQINVGVGFLNYPSFPRVNINGNSMTSANNGFFNYKTKVTGKPGKYIVPIKIEYYDSFKKIIVNKKVEYYIN
jgi:hypothetical protein